MGKIINHIGRAVHRFMPWAHKVEQARALRAAIDLIHAEQAEAERNGLPLPEWAHERCPPDHHPEMGADGLLRFAPDTPEIAARDEAEHEAALEFEAQADLYLTSPYEPARAADEYRRQWDLGEPEVVTDAVFGELWAEPEADEPDLDSDGPSQAEAEADLEAAIELERALDPEVLSDPYGWAEAEITKPEYFRSAQIDEAESDCELEL